MFLILQALSDSFLYILIYTINFSLQTGYQHSQFNGIKSYAPLAQLVEQLTLNQLVEGSSPSWCTKVNYTDSVAQLVEQWPFKPLVVRSSRTGVTMFPLAAQSKEEPL